MPDALLYLQAGEVAQLEARHAALASVAQRLPVLREQHARQVAEVDEVAQMELKIAELKQQVSPSSR